MYDWHIVKLQGLGAARFSGVFVYLPLTDVLACPRCAPDSGLVLLAERIVERRVLEGAVACPACDTRYPIHAGFVDFREGNGGAPASGAVEPAVPESADPDEAFRLAALLGVREGPAYLLLCGALAGLAARVAEIVPNVEVVGALAALRSWREATGVTRMATGARLPFFARSLRALALPMGDDTLAEAARVVSPAGRVVLLACPADVRERARAAGLDVLVHEGATAVARPA